MKSFKITLCLFSFACLLSVSSSAQKVDTLVKKLDSLHKQDERTSKKPNLETDKEDFTYQTNITPKAYFVLLGTDLVQEVTGPFHASKKTWLEVGGFALLEGGLFLADKSIRNSNQDFMVAHKGARDVSAYVTNFGGLYEIYTLAAFGAYGIIFKSNKVKTTTLLATQSYIAAGAVSSIVKYLTGRQRPYSYDPNNPGPEPDFRGPYPDALNSSFPSGHTTAAFSAATVFATEYHDEILIPVIAYSAATLVGLSRITENAHWASDVFAGAALGYVTGKQVVRNYHRYARIRSGQQKTAWFFNLQYNNGIIMPQVVCRF